MIFKYNNQGKAGFLKHAKSNQHKHNADGRNRRLPAQLAFFPPTADSQNNAIGLTDEEDDSGEEEQERGTAGFLGSRARSVIEGASESADISSQVMEEGVSGLQGHGQGRGGTSEIGGQGLNKFAVQMVGHLYQ